MTDEELVEGLTRLLETGRLRDNEADYVTEAAMIIKKKVLVKELIAAKHAAAKAAVKELADAVWGA